MAIPEGFADPEPLLTELLALELARLEAQQPATRSLLTRFRYRRARHRVIRQIRRGRNLANW